MLRVLVLGAAAGGGVPQWNCNCAICAEARSEGGRVPAASQSSIAVSADGSDWFLVNASPDLRSQIAAHPGLHPRHGLRDTPIAGIVLTNGDIDAIAGLLHLREGASFSIWAHPKVLDVLDGNSVFNVLAPHRVARRPIAPDAPFDLTLPDGRASGLSVEAFTVPGKVPLYAENQHSAPVIGIEAGDTLGLAIRDEAAGRTLAYVAACAAVTPALADRLRGADVVFFDGTLWRDDEMVAAGLGVKTGQRMGHISISGEQGALRAFATLNVGRKIFIHINNSNPVLVHGSAERCAVEAAGWEVAYDGLAFAL